MTPLVVALPPGMTVSPALPLETKIDTYSAYGLLAGVEGHSSPVPSSWPPCRPRTWYRMFSSSDPGKVGVPGVHAGRAGWTWASGARRGAPLELVAANVSRVEAGRAERQP